ncbi:hypothetical protein ACHAXS_009662 [Conticribra weissflogii]
MPLLKSCFFPYLFLTHVFSRPFLHRNKCGLIGRFDTAKGFGFIVPDDGSGDIFVHQTAINVQGFRSLAEDERVEFRTEADQNGRIRALDVTGPDGADVKGAPYPSNNDFDEW